MLQFITIHLGSVHNSCVSLPLCSRLCPHFRLLTQATEWSDKQLSTNQPPSGWATAHCGLYTSWWPGHWTDTQSFDRVHTSHSSAQNEHKLCVPCVKIHRRHSGEASDVSSTHEQRSHSRVCGCNTCGLSKQWPA
jgi:hypothetical protein